VSATNGTGDVDLRQTLEAEIDRLTRQRDDIEEQLLRHRAALGALTTPVALRTRPRASAEVRQQVLAVVIGMGPISTREVAALPQFADTSPSTVGAALTWLRRTNQITTRERTRQGQVWSAP
jgi:hypothetical protein